MDCMSTREAELMQLRLPQAGLAEVAAGWMGPGRLIDALAAVAGADDIQQWSSSDIRQRVNHILLSRIAEPISQLPTAMRDWEQYLPATIVTERQVRRSPTTKIDWARTVREYGWRPDRYVALTRGRSLSEVPLTTLAWLSHEVEQLLADVSPPPLQRAQIASRCEILHNVARRHLVGIPPVRPDRLELRALATSGYPWRDIANAATVIDRAQRDPAFLAFELLEPDPGGDLAWRLFHVATFGITLATLRENGHRITWNFPLGGTGTGPQITTRSGDDTSCDVWFEAGSARSYYGLGASTYHQVVSALSDVTRSVAPDVLVLSSRSRALILECKWSSDPNYIARAGYHQVSSYALDALDGLATEVWAFTVGPEEIIPASTAALSAWDQLSLLVGLTSIVELRAVICAFLIGDTNFCQTLEPQSAISSNASH